MKISHHVRLIGLCVLAFSISDAFPAPGSATPVPAYELTVGREDWTKLQRTAHSDERYPAKFLADGKEYPVTIRYRGDWARSWPKKPLKIFFAKGTEFGGQHVLNLNSCWRDPAFIREQLAYHVYTACGVPASRTRMVKLNVNGHFYGLFLEVEQPEKSLLKRHNLKGAAVYKTSSHAQQADERDLGTEAAFHAHYEKETRKAEDYSDLQRFCHELGTTTNVAAFFAVQVDVDRYVNFLAASALVQNWDWFSKNHFLVHDSAGSKKWFVVPWDLDRTFGDHWQGAFDAANVPLRLGTAAQPSTIGWNKMFNAFWNEPALRKRLFDRMENLLQSEFTREKLFPLLDEWETEIGADVTRDRQRWPNRAGGNLHAGVNGVKEFILERRTFLLRQIKTGRATPARP